MNAKSTLYLGLVTSLVFTILVWIVSTTFSDIYLLPDQGATWYYWKLPNPTLVTRATAWGGYILHQIGLWWIIYKAQKAELKYSDSLHKYNIWALGWNVGFIIVHLLQSYFFYDGLAQDVSIWSSQGSVILMLVWVILMLNDRRGILFGKRAPFKTEIIKFAKKYHGYVFAWATVYTFWYHPTEGTWGHLLGFFYMFMLLLQGSLFFTRIHINKYWMVALELFVLVHGATVAYFQGGDLWPMFLFGFWGAYILIYLWGLKLSKFWIAINLAFFVIVWLIIWSRFGFENSHQTLWIPIIYYLGVGILYLLIYLILKFKNFVKFL